VTHFDNTVRSILLFGGDPEEALDKAMAAILNRFRSETITLHLLDRARDMLVMRASRGLAPALREITREIPMGKGIAGEAARTGQPVTSCNIQKEDGAGVVPEGAKKSGLGGALCVPLFRRNENGEDEVIGSLGIGTTREHTYIEEETTNLTSVGRVLASELSTTSV